ncbi:MAG: signal peptide peptidase SppA [Cytophagia bacterium]|nr:signal peptide peptidase SppA [Cytophagia bacterium]
MGFWKSFFATLLALFVFSVISFFLMIGFIGALSSEAEVVVADNSVLHLNLDAQITEQQVDNPFEGLPVLGGEVASVGLIELKEALRQAKDDSKIKGIYLTVSYPMTGFATLEEIRLSLLDFKSSGKWVVAYGDMMSEAAYYLASAADKVYLNPQGDVEWNGLAIEVSFFKRMFEKLEIKPEVFRVGEFKSAVEPFMLDKMSNENKLQLTETINSIYDYVVTQVSTARGIDKVKLREMSDKMLVRNAKQAVEYSLIDSLLYDDQLTAELKSRLSLAGDDDIDFIKLSKYRKSYTSFKSSKNEIAIIVGDGEIMPGKGSEGIIGGDKFAEQVRKARENDKVKAIVIRVNSPGGSFQASDIMWREITLAKQVKPVIASMGDYAASGGYYMAMGCDTIVAQPHTITGSIGIFSVLFDASGLMSNKLGISTEQVKTGEFGEMITVSRPLTEQEKAVWQRKTEEGYEVFTSKAAEGRNMDVEELKKVASGRVWTGAQAKERGLVDVLGGFDDAIQLAAEAAGISADYKVKYYPQKLPFFQELMLELEDNARVNALQQELGMYYPFYMQMQRVQHYNGMQARLPFELSIH